MVKRKQLKILHFIKDFSLPTETFIYDLLVRSSKIQDYKICVLCLERHQKIERPFNDVKLIQKHRRWYWRVLDHFLNNSFEKRLVNFVKKYNPDVIHAHFGPNGVFIKGILEEFGITDIPTLISMHGSDATMYLKIDEDYKRKLKSFTYDGNIFFTVNSKYLNRKLTDFGVERKRLFTLYNTIHPNFFDDKKENSFKYGDKLKIISIGRLVPIKGYDYLIEGFAQFNHMHYDNSVLTIIGYGNKLFELSELVKKWGIEKKVNFIKAIPHNKISDHLDNHNLYIQPSIHYLKYDQCEAFGISVVEAISRGLPVIVTNTGGLPEAIIRENKNAHLIKDKSAQAIKNKLLEFVENPQYFKFDSEYQSEVTKKFSSTEYDSKLSNIYNKLTQHVQ